MTISSVASWSTTASNNTDLGGHDISEGCSPAEINDAIRELMAQGKTKFTSHDSAIAAIAASGIASVKKDTLANLNADLAYAAGTIAFVYADPTTANNDIYAKAGGSGSGSWSATGILGAMVDAKVTPALTAAVAQVTAPLATIANRTQRIGDRDPMLNDGNTVTGAAQTFILYEPALQNGTIKRFRVDMDPVNFTTGTLYLRRYTVSGGTATKTGTDTALSLVKGINDFQVSIAINAGEYVGFYAPAGIVVDGAFQGYPAGGPPLVSLGLGDVSSATATSSTTDKLLVAAEISYSASELRPSTEDRFVAATAAFKAFSIATTFTVDRGGDLATGTDTRTLTTPTNVRYDVIYRDMEAGTIGVLSGTDATDAAERIPALTSSKHKALFNVRVSSIGITNAVAVWDVLDGEIRSLSDFLEAERRRSRRCLPKTRAKLAKGASLKIIGFGHSIAEIGALGVGSNVTMTAAPNGSRRDRATNGTSYYLANTGSDLRSALPLYTAVQLGRTDDSAGAVHTRFGYNWELIAAIEGRGQHTLGTNLFYDNWGIAGTATTDAVSGSTPTAWLTNAAASGADLAIVHFAMNELGNAGTEDRLIVIANTFKAAGIEVLFMGEAHIRPSFGGGAQPSPYWEYSNRAIQRAARFTNSAWLPSLPLYDERYTGAIGLAVEDACMANGNNHPGILEHKAWGRELSKTVLGTI